ncbi:hypothetical protein BDW71DRAFT_141783 [Aspergillus fruticulosus]
MQPSNNWHGRIAGPALREMRQEIEGPDNDKTMDCSRDRDYRVWSKKERRGKRLEWSSGLCQPCYRLTVRVLLLIFLLRRFRLSSLSVLAAYDLTGLLARHLDY